MAGAVRRGKHGRGAGDIRAMRDFQIPVRGVIVADEAEAVAADRDGRVLSDIPRPVQRTDGRGGASLVGAVGYLEVAVGRVVVADQSQAVGSDRDRAVLTGVARAISDGEGKSGTLKGRIIRLGSNSQLHGRTQREHDPASDGLPHRHPVGSDPHEAPYAYSLA